MEYSAINNRLPYYVKGVPGRANDYNRQLELAAARYCGAVVYESLRHSTKEQILSSLETLIHFLTRQVAAYSKTDIFLADVLVLYYGPQILFDTLETMFPFEFVRIHASDKMHRDWIGRERILITEKFYNTDQKGNEVALLAYMHIHLRFMRKIKPAVAACTFRIPFFEWTTATLDMLSGSHAEVGAYLKSNYKAGRHSFIPAAYIRTRVFTRSTYTTLVYTRAEAMARDKYDYIAETPLLTNVGIRTYEEKMNYYNRVAACVAPATCYSFPIEDVIMSNADTHTNIAIDYCFHCQTLVSTMTEYVRCVAPDSSIEAELSRVCTAAGTDLHTHHSMYVNSLKYRAFSPTTSLPVFSAVKKRKNIAQSAPCDNRKKVTTELEPEPIISEQDEGWNVVMTKSVSAGLAKRRAPSSTRHVHVSWRPNIPGKQKVSTLTRASK